MLFDYSTIELKLLKLKLDLESILFYESNEGEKKHKKGGLNCVLKNFSSLSVRTVLRFRV